MTALSPAALDQLFNNARTFNKFTDQALSDEQLQAIYDLAKMAPTAFNASPARFVFVRSEEAKKRLIPLMMEGNQAKSMAAPVTVIVAYDSNFQEHLPTLFPAMDVKGMFDANPAMTETTAFRNGSLTGAYFIMAVRALGLDAGAMSGFDNTAVDKEFFPDGRFKSNFLINIGHGDASGNYPRSPRLSFDEAAQIL
ncbi:putative malonic semialdehyde reductase RutE [Ephemeroptericola cinctiostellae]|uniref:Putative NADH dehydrogenase/NAD(P)H nitroreductase DTO96_100583 n=1 Tax=Ephemeroptericola cinctiostellae TaxID=2268024 RepID=A0A345D934_9BURK|nr:malonic semialdehyde reductase [Ephemeroptericola cinctiostellae]AXF84872.1 putative malonic semialdehyde reductase RutE [Ephemeroptericola cinctiostellae]